MTMTNGLRDSISKVAYWVPISRELLNPTPLSAEEITRLRVERETRVKPARMPDRRPYSPVVKQ